MSKDAKVFDAYAALRKHPDWYDKRDSILHRDLAATLGYASGDVVRGIVNRERERRKQAPALTEAHKTISLADYMARIDDPILQDDSAKIYAALKRLRALGRHIRVLILSDEHFDDHDERAVTMNIRIAAYSQPDLVILNGDTFDFSGISHYTQDRRAGKKDVLSVIRKPYSAYIQALVAAAPNAVFVFLDGNHNERMEIWGNENNWQFADTTEQAYADLVRQGGRVLWMNGKQEIDIFGHHVMHGERASKNAASATLDDFGGGQPVSAGHIHKIQKVYRRVKKQGENRWVIVTSCFAGFAGNNPPAYVKRKRDQIHWIQACQLVHVNPHGDDVHINEIPFHESVDGGLIAVCGIEVLTVNAVSAAATKAA